MVQKHYIRNAPKGGGFAGFLRKLAGTLPFIAAFFAIYSLCDFLFLTNTAADIAAYFEYKGELALPRLEGGVLNIVAAFSLGWLCFYFLYMAYRKSPMIFYWGSVVLLLGYPLVMLFGFYTDAVAMSASVSDGEPSERFSQFAAFMQSLNPAWVFEDGSFLLKYALCATALLIVFWFAPLGFTLKRIAQYNKRYNLYGDADKPVRELTSFEYATRRSEIWWSFAGFTLFSILFLAYAFSTLPANYEELPSYDAYRLLQSVVGFAWAISAVLFFHRIWRALPRDISKMNSIPLLVMAFIPVLDLFAKYKLTIGVMRGFNRSFESLGFRGYRINTVIAVVFWVLVGLFCVSSVFYALYVYPRSPEADAMEIAAAVSKIELYAMCWLVAILVFWTVLTLKMSLTATTLLKAFEYTKATQAPQE